MAVTTHKYRKYSANFKTAYLQREVVLDAIVDGDNFLEADYSTTADMKLHVGDVVKYDPATKKLGLAVAYHASSDASIDDANAIKVGNFIVAQSDETMEYGHIPVENRDYRYSDEVKDNASTKKVALFRINDVDDINYKVTKFDATTGE